MSRWSLCKIRRCCFFLLSSSKCESLKMLKSWILWGEKPRAVRKWIVRTQKEYLLCSVSAVTASLGDSLAHPWLTKFMHLLGDILGKLLASKAVLCSHNTVGVGIFSCIAWLSNCWWEESAPIKSSTRWRVKTGKDVRLLKSIPIQLCWTCISWGLWIPGQHLRDDRLAFATPALAWRQAVKQSSSRPFSIAWHFDC